MWAAPSPGQVVLDYLRKLAKLEPGSGQAAFLHGFASSACPDFVEWWTVIWKYKADKCFPPLSYFWSECFTTATERELLLLPVSLVAGYLISCFHAHSVCYFYLNLLKSNHKFRSSVTTMIGSSMQPLPRQTVLDRGDTALHFHPCHKL